MKNTELKNWKTGHYSELLEKRLVWMAVGEAPKDPVVEDKKKDEKKGDKKEEKEVLDASKDLGDKLNILAERIKDLTVGTDAKPIDIKKPNAVDLQAALKGAVEAIAKDLGIQRLDIYLMDGLLENIGKADKKPNVLGSTELTELTKWLGDKKIAKFTIDKGFWKFFDKDGGAILAEYKLDEKGEPVVDGGKVVEGKLPKGLVDKKTKKADKDKKPEAKPEEKKKPSDKAVLSKGVGKVKKEEAEKAAGDAEDVARKNPDKLEKASSSVEVTVENILKEKITSAQLGQNLENGMSKFGKINAIKAEEIEASINNYIKNVPGKTADAKFTNFIKIVQDKGFTSISVEKGMIVFRKADGTESSNPLNLEVKGQPELLYAHEALKASKEAKGKEEIAKREKEKADILEDKSDKPNKFDATEKAAAELLKQPGAKELPVIDSRYLRAFEAILKFDAVKGQPVKFDIPFGDSELNCTFYKSPNGTFVLQYNDANKANITFTPKVGSTDPFGEAKVFLLNTLNSGEMLQGIQKLNIQEKSFFTKYGVNIDSGPKTLNNGQFEYELDWNTGLTEKDPHIFITALPHGAINVHVVKSDIGINGENEFDFVAGGMKDMMRGLRNLEKWHDNPEKNSSSEKADEGEKRFLSKGVDGLKDLVPKEAGKLLKVDSVGSTIDLDLKHGYLFRFDWMEKLEPAQKLQVYKVGNKFEVIMSPDGRLLGRTDDMSKGGFQEMMKMVALQRTEFMTKGGDKMVANRVNNLIDDYNKKIGSGELITKVNGVGITGYSGVGDGPQMVYMTLADGMAPKGFDFKIYNVDGKLLCPGMEQAVAQGYFIKANAETVKSAAPEAVVGGTKKVPAEGGKLDVKKTAEVSVLRDSKEGPLISPVAKARIDSIVKEIKDPNKKVAVGDCLKVYLTGEIEDGKVEGIAFAALKDFTEVTNKILAAKPELNSPDLKIKWLISFINKPKSKENKSIEIKSDKTWQADWQKSFGKYPRAFNVILSNLNILSYASDRAGDDKVNGRNFWDTYGVMIKNEVEVKVKELTARIPAPKAVGIDKELAEYISKTFKNGMTELLPEWKKALAAQKEAVAAKEADDVKSSKNKEFEVRKAGHHGIGFAAFESGSIGNLGLMAKEVFKSTAALKPDQIYMSNLKDNTTFSDKLMSFNVMLGSVKEQKAYTINFIKNGSGPVVMKIAEGWNNTKNLPDISTTKEKQPDPVAYLLMRVGAYKGPAGAALD